MVIVLAPPVVWEGMAGVAGTFTVSTAVVILMVLLGAVAASIAATVVLITPLVVGLVIRVYLQLV